MRCISLPLELQALVLALMVLPPSVWASPVIQVRANSELDMQQEITIGDIAEFIGFNEQDVSDVRAARVADAPRVGAMVSFTDAEVSQAFRPYLSGLQSKHQERIRLLIPSKVVVTRKTFRLEVGEIESELRRQWNGICAECEFELSNLTLPTIGPRAVPGGSWKIRVRPELPRGSFAIPMEIEESGGRRSYWVNGEVRIFRRVAVSRRVMESGERMSAADYAFERRDVTYQNESYPTENEITSAVVTRAIPTGQVLSRTLLRREQAVKSGDTVKLVAGTDDWQVTVEGTAQNAAYIGEQVRVRVARSQKMVAGILREKGIVEVR